MTNRRHTLLFVAALLASLLLTALVYLPGLPGAFVFDDIGAIVDNPAVKLQAFDYLDLTRAVLSAPTGGLLRPISTLSFALEAHFLGISPWHFKLINIFIHLAVGLILWFLSRELLRGWSRTHGVSLSDGRIAWIGLVVSTLWLVHPLNLTSVLYTVQRENSLCALFTASAILSYLKGRRTPGMSGRLFVWVLTPSLVVAGMLCKENAALTPIYILVIECTLFGPPGRGAVREKEVHGFLILFLALPLCAAAVLLAIRPGFFLAGYTLRDFTLYERLLSEARIVMDYLRWALIPDLRQLGLFHDDIAPSRGLLDPVTTLFSLTAIAALVTAAITLRKRFPLLSFGLLWFFAGQLLESTVLPLELAYEHRNYLPLFGLILGLTGTIYLWASEAKRVRLLSAAAAGCIALFAGITVMRAADWHDELSFARSESRHHPHSARALSELQWAYLNYVVSTQDQRLMPALLDAARMSKQADPYGINQDIGVAYAYASLHDLPDAQSWLHTAATDAAMAAPSSTLQLALQTLLTMTGTDYQGLYRDIDGVFQATLHNTRLQTNPCFEAGLWNTYGVFQDNVGAVTGALGAMHRAITLCPRDTQMRLNFTDMLLRHGDTQDAAPQLDVLKNSLDLRYQMGISKMQARYMAELEAQRKN